MLYNAAPLNTFCLHKFPPPPPKKIPIYSSVSMHISDTDDWIHTKWCTSSETDRISFRLTRELIAKATGNDKVFKNGLHQHKEGNVRITQHFGKLVQPLLEYKTDKYYILRVYVCSLKYPACNARAPYCRLWSVRMYSIFPHYLINGTI